MEAYSNDHNGDACRTGGRRCGHCGLVWDRSEFWSDKSKQDGLSSLCRLCKSAYAIRSRKLPMELRRRWARSRRDQGRSVAEIALAANVCGATIKNWLRADAPQAGASEPIDDVRKPKLGPKVQPTGK